MKRRGFTVCLEKLLQLVKVQRLVSARGTHRFVLSVQELRFRCFGIPGVRTD
jgi:hypothetical protein